MLEVKYTPVYTMTMTFLDFLDIVVLEKPTIGRPS